MPEAQIAPALARGTVQVLSDAHVDVELFWQHWGVESPLLAALTEMITQAAPDHLV